MAHRTAVYTGSFDPITLGHLNVIERASRLTDLLIVGIGHNAEKKSLFTPEERVELVESSTSHLDNVEVKSVFWVGRRIRSQMRFASHGPRRPPVDRHCW